jgi:hypothetical protein
MLERGVRWVVLALLAGCSEKTVPIAKTDPKQGASVPVDLGSERPAPHPGELPHVAVAPPPSRAGHPVEITLRSSPPGATAAVDGTIVGITPAYWAGDTDGREHEFTFDLRGYSLARYRFVPVTSGVIHARLDPITEETDAGVAAEQALPKTGSVLVNPPAATTPDAVLASPPPPAEGSSNAGMGPQP